MDDFEEDPVFSPLSQSLTREGHAVEVQIYADGEGGWLLEVVDSHGNSTVWGEAFATDRAAWDHLLKTIDEEGISVVVGSPPAQQASIATTGALSYEELEELDSQLARSASGTAMNVAMLDGFLTAIAIGPVLVMPSEWLPWVWDLAEAEVAAPFEDMAQANAVISLLMRHYNSLIETFNSTQASIVPVFWRGVQWDAIEWCDGFIMGHMFDEDSWDRLAVEHPRWIEPFLRLAGSEEFGLAGQNTDPERWIKKVGPSLLHIDAYWKAQRASHGPWTESAPLPEYGFEPLRRNGPKIGRNDPCPCGSGKKFKKCCGADRAPGSIH